MGKCAVILVTLAACVNVPKFIGGSGDANPAIDGAPRPPGDVSVRAGLDGHGGATVDGGYYQLHFASTGAHFPDSLVIQGVEVLAHQACPDEDALGIAAAPATTSSASDATGTLALGGPDGTWVGPAIARVDLTWSHPLCGGTISGTSIFTITPNGQVIRDDTVQALSAGAPDTCACGATDTKFTLTSYAGFARAHFTQLVTNTGALSISGPESNFGTWACLDGTAGHVAAGWDNSGNGTRTNPTTDAIALVYELDASATINNSYHHILDYQIDDGHRACADLGALADAANNRTNIDTASTSEGYDDQHVYDLGNASPVTLSATSSTVPPGFAVHFQFPNLGMPAIARTPALTGTWYIAQPDGDGFVVWFRDALEHTSTITIMAP